MREVRERKVGKVKRRRSWGKGLMEQETDRAREVSRQKRHNLNIEHVITRVHCENVT